MSSVGESLVNCNLYVRGFSMQWTEVELKAMFEKHGTIASLKVLYDPVTTASRCMGFVRFEQHQDAAAAISALDGIIPPDSYTPLIVKFAKDNGLPHSKSTRQVNQRFTPYGTIEEQKDMFNLYLRDLPLTMTEEELNTMMAQYGTIVTCKLSPDRYTGKSRGVAFCRYQTMEAAAAAIGTLENKMLAGSTVPLKVQYTRDTSRKATPATITTHPSGLLHIAPGGNYPGAPQATQAPAAYGATQAPAAAYGATQAAYGQTAAYGAQAPAYPGYDAAAYGAATGTEQYYYPQATQPQVTQTPEQGAQATQAQAQPQYYAQPTPAASYPPQYPPVYAPYGAAPAPPAAILPFPPQQPVGPTTTYGKAPKK